MPSKLWEYKDGTTPLTVPEYEYGLLDHEAKEARFLVVQPCKGDKAAPENHVSCHFEVQSLATEVPIPFIAVEHARGYRNLSEVIEVDGKGLIVPAAIEVFLRHFRRSDEPIRLWIRYICLNEADRQEYGVCWNRQFVDFIYEKADSRVDMADFNNQLVENGVSQATPLIRDWKKHWNDLSEQDKLPCVFPHRLGKKPSNDNPDGFLEYVALDTIADEIRVLVVMPSTDWSAPLITHLGHCPLVSEVAYCALSYVWGTRDETETIVVNGQWATVQKNLANALRALRPPEGKVPIWVDALCIDQTNIAERNRQIPRIAKVYDRAIAVVCYVGEADEDSDMALNFVNYLQCPMMSMDEELNWICRNSKDDHKSARELPRLCGALYRLLSRPYFRRVWILQELAFASIPTIVCGTNREIEVQRLDNAAYNLADMLGRDPALVKEMIEVTPGITEFCQHDLMYIRNLVYFRHVTMKGAGSAWPGVQYHWPGSPISPGFLESAILARKFEATVASDKIYALWNLANDKDGFEFQMDYSQSTPEAYTSFTIAWTKHSGSLDMIGASELNLRSIDFYSMAPSWCPDWSVPSEVSCMIRKEMLLNRMMRSQGDLDGQLYSADGGVKQTPDGIQYFSFESRTLHCMGIIIDEVKSILDPLSDGETHSFQNLLDSVIYFFGGRFAEKYDGDPARAAWAMASGDNITTWPRREDNPEMVQEKITWERYVCLPRQARHIHPYAGSYCRVEAGDVRETVLRGRQLIATAQEYIGLAPSYIGDLSIEGPAYIAILATCSVPVLLTEQSPGVYKFAGTCFVQGWMDGEMVTEFMGAESADEFWRSMQDVDRLMIV